LVLGVCGEAAGVCGALPGVDVCEPEVWPFCWLEFVPDGDVLFGCVWAATQRAESSSTENSGAFNFMGVSPLRKISTVRM
jgi:hypothetical protein